MRNYLSALLGAGSVLFSLQGYAAATSDGVQLIDQAAVLAAGGFPYHITKSGSYRLSSDLVVSGNADGIEISANAVTLDLNGFTMTGGGEERSGSAISSYNDTVNYTGISVRNGSMSGWNAAFTGNNCNLCTAKQLIIFNSMNGIVLGDGGIVVETTVSSGRSHVSNDGTVGIAVNTDGSMIANNTSGFGTGLTFRRCRG